MVKKKAKKDEEEEEEFGPPPFDEKAFYSGEMETAKATIITAILGILIAAVSTGVYAATHDFTIGVALGLGAAIVIKPLLDRLKVNTTGWGITKWGTSAFSYLTCWLAFWILFVNPPIMDLSAPILKDQTPQTQELGSHIRLDIWAVDNTEITSLSAKITRPDYTEQTFTDFMQDSGHLFRLDLNFNATGNYTYRVRADDPYGHSTTITKRMEIVAQEPPSITLIAPSNGSQIATDQSIRVDIRDNAQVASVFYILDNGTEHILLKQGKPYQSFTHVYYIRPNASGHQWTGGAHTVTVEATDGAGLVTTATYNFTLL